MEINYSGTASCCPIHSVIPFILCCSRPLNASFSILECMRRFIHHLSFRRGLDNVPNGLCNANLLFNSHTLHNTALSPNCWVNFPVFGSVTAVRACQKFWNQATLHMWRNDYQNFCLCYEQADLQKVMNVKCSPARFCRFFGHSWWLKCTMKPFMVKMLQYP